MIITTSAFRLSSGVKFSRGAVIFFLQFPRTRCKLALISKLWLAEIHPRSVIFLLSIHRDVSRPICTSFTTRETFPLSYCRNRAALIHRCFSFISNKKLSPPFLHSLKNQATIYHGVINTPLPLYRCFIFVQREKEKRVTFSFSRNIYIHLSRNNFEKKFLTVVCKLRITLFHIFKKSSRSLSLSLSGNLDKWVQSRRRCCITIMLLCEGATMHGNVKKLLGKTIRGK